MAGSVVVRDHSDGAGTVVTVEYEYDSIGHVSD